MPGKAISPLKKLRRAITFFGVTKARKDSNTWLRRHTPGIGGRILSIGSGDDQDGMGSTYREYFTAAESYTTSELTPDFEVDLVIDVRSMPEIEKASYECIFCSGVLEHVGDFKAGYEEITRILAPGGILLLGLPFRQALHMQPHDFWRFTEFGIRFLLKDDYEILVLDGIDDGGKEFPASYWTKARKLS